MNWDWPVEPLITAKGHLHKGGRPQGTTWGPLVVLSAIRGTEPSGAVSDDLLTQARRCFANLAEVLAEAGSDTDRVLRVGMYLKDLQGDRPVVDVAWHEAFGDAGPARFAVQVTDLGAAGDASRLLLDVVAVRSGPPAS